MLRGQHAPLVSILTAASSGHPVPGFFSFSLYRRVCLAQACGRDRGVSARRPPPAPCAGICCPLESAPKLAFFKGKSWWKASAVNRVRVAEPEKIPPPPGLSSVRVQGETPTGGPARTAAGCSEGGGIHRGKPPPRPSTFQIIACLSFQDVGHQGLARSWDHQAGTVSCRTGNKPAKH